MAARRRRRNDVRARHTGIDDWPHRRWRRSPRRDRSCRSWIPAAAAAALIIIIVVFVVRYVGGGRR